MRAFTLAVVLALACTASSTAAPRHLRVLFVGNSLTATNDLPATVAEIAAKAGRVRVEVETVAPGGYALEDHWADGRALGKLRDEHWDVVVLQQGPSSLPESRANLIEWAKRWADEARANGARAALLTVWPERARSYAFADVVRNYRDAARSAGAASYPAGLAWRVAWRTRPSLPLYGPDAFHPSPLGSYLAALVVYAGLTGELPRTLPAAGGVRPTGATARLLRSAAGAVW